MKTKVWPAHPLDMMLNILRGILMQFDCRNAGCI